jgi:hypothetical protein
MLHVDDLIEPGAEQILLSGLPPFRWLHPVPRQSLQRRVNHKTNLQGIPSAHPIPGKLNCANLPLPDSKSTTWEFFTDDYLTRPRCRPRLNDHRKRDRGTTHNDPPDKFGLHDLAAVVPSAEIGRGSAKLG